MNKLIILFVLCLSSIFLVSAFTQSDFDLIKTNGGGEVNGTYNFNSTQFDIIGETNVSIKTTWLETFVNALSKWANYYTKTEIDNFNFTTNESALAYINSTGYVINWSDVIGGGGASPLTTKGDLYTYSDEDTRLEVGTDGQILSADSSEDTGLKWIDASSGGSLWEDNDKGINPIDDEKVILGGIYENHYYPAEFSSSSTGMGGANFIAIPSLTYNNLDAGVSANHLSIVSSLSASNLGHIYARELIKGEEINVNGAFATFSTDLSGLPITRTGGAYEQVLITGTSDGKDGFYIVGAYDGDNNRFYLINLAGSPPGFSDETVTATLISMRGVIGGWLGQDNMHRILVPYNAGVPATIYENYGEQKSVSWRQGAEEKASVNYNGDIVTEGKIEANEFYGDGSTLSNIAIPDGDNGVVQFADAFGDLKSNTKFKWQDDATDHSLVLGDYTTDRDNYDSRLILKQGGAGDDASGLRQAGVMTLAESSTAMTMNWGETTPFEIRVGDILWTTTENDGIVSVQIAEVIDEETYTLTEAWAYANDSNFAILGKDFITARNFFDDIRFKVYSNGDVYAHSYFADGHMFVEGNVTASGFITTSKVAEIDGVMALDSVENIENWTKEDGEINYKEHYAMVEFMEKKFIGYELRNITRMICEDYNINKNCYYETKEEMTPIFETKKRYGLDMEKRVAEMEKMIWELLGKVRGSIDRITGAELKIELLESNITQLQSNITNLQSENTLIKSELCKKDNTYSWCKVTKD